MNEYITAQNHKYLITLLHFRLKELMTYNCTYTVLLFWGMPKKKKKQQYFMFRRKTSRLSYTLELRLCKDICLQHPEEEESFTWIIN